jgi:hypothetical protein
MNDFGLLVGRFFTALPTLTNEQLSELMLDASGRLIISGRYLEDSAHVSGDAGIQILAVRDDGVRASATVGPNVFTAVNFGTVGNSISLIFDGIDDVTTVVAAWNAANPTNTVSFTGSGATVPSAQTVNLIGGAANTVLTSASGDYSPLSVDQYGRLNVVAAVSIEPSDAEFREDTPNTSGDVGLHVLTVRQDTLATSTSASGDYADFKVNALGELYVHDTSSLAELVLANASLDAIESDVDAIRVEQLAQGLTLDNIDSNITLITADIDAIRIEQLDQGVTLDGIKVDTAAIAVSTDGIDDKLGALSKAEDSAHTSGDQGIMALAVRNDADAVLTSANLDYSPIAVDSAGRIKTLTQITLAGTEAYAVTDDLAAAGDGLETITASATPWVTVASYLHQTGTMYVYGWQWGCDVTDDGADVILYKRSVNSSAQPSYSEHFSEGGRIEIAGAANLEIKLQIKKRSASGGNALGTGSLHMRVV